MTSFLHQIYIAFCVALAMQPVLAINISAEFTEFYDGVAVRSYTLSADDLTGQVAKFDAFGSGGRQNVPNGPSYNVKRSDSTSRCGAEYNLPATDGCSISSIYGSWVVPQLIQRSEGIPENPPLDWQWIVEWVGVDNVDADGQSSQDCSLLEVGVLSLVSTSESLDAMATESS